MNFFLLSLTNKVLRRTATCLRRMTGALYGAVIYCMMFVTPVFTLLVRLVVGGAFALLGMAYITFNCKSVRQIVKVIPTMAVVMLIMGGIFFVLAGKLTFITSVAGGLPAAVAIGGAVYIICDIIVVKIRKLPQPICKVELITDCGKVEVNALIDTGNLLVEPISQRPVSVLDEGSLRRAFGGELPEYYRVVPYTSIGRKKGILKCFEVSGVLINTQEEKRVYEKVLVACGDEHTLSGSCMILNPRLFNKEEYKYDI